MNSKTLYDFINEACKQDDSDIDVSIAELTSAIHTLEKEKEKIINCRAQAFGVIMFTQKILPYEELRKYWEDEGVWYKFNDIAREKNR